MAALSKIDSIQKNRVNARPTHAITNESTGVWSRIGQILSNIFSCFMQLFTGWGNYFSTRGTPKKIEQTERETETEKEKASIAIQAALSSFTAQRTLQASLQAEADRKAMAQEAISKLLNRTIGIVEKRHKAEQLHKAANMYKAMCNKNTTKRILGKMVDYMRCQAAQKAEEAARIEQSRLIESIDPENIITGIQQRNKEVEAAEKAAERLKEATQKKEDATTVLQLAIKAFVQRTALKKLGAFNKTQRGLYRKTQKQDQQKKLELEKQEKMKRQKLEKQKNKGKWNRTLQRIASTGTALSLFATAAPYIVGVE